MKTKQNNRQSNKKRISILPISLCLFFLFLTVFVVAIFFENDFDDFLNFRIERFVVGDIISDGDLKIHFIDVGHGDATLIELPNGQVVLIDAGDRFSHINASLKTYIDQVNQQRFNRGIGKFTSFDYVILTHSHADHAGGLEFILNHFPAKTFFRPNEMAIDSSNPNYSDPALLQGENLKNGFWNNGFGQPLQRDTATFRRALAAGHRADNVIIIDPFDSRFNRIVPDLPDCHNHFFSIDFFGPLRSRFGNNQSASVNNISPFILISYQGRHIMLSGDAERVAEGEFVSAVLSARDANSNPSDEMCSAGEECGECDCLQMCENLSRFLVFSKDFSVDILLLGHHGSITSSTTEYLNLLTNSAKIKQLYVAISVDEAYANSRNWQLPSLIVLDRLGELGVLSENIFRTDLDGSFAFTVFYCGTEGEAASVLRGNIGFDSNGNIIFDTEFVYPHSVFNIQIRSFNLFLSIATFSFFFLVFCLIFKFVLSKRSD